MQLICKHCGNKLRLVTLTDGTDVFECTNREPMPHVYQLEVVEPPC